MLLKNNKILLLSLGLLSISPFTVKAQATPEPHIIIVPRCLIHNGSVEFHTLSAVNNFSLLSVTDTGLDNLIDMRKKSPASCGGFRDVTRAWKALAFKTRSTQENAHAFLSGYFHWVNPPLTASDYSIKSVDEVNQLFLQLDAQAMWYDLTTLTNFEDRNARSNTGVAASDWIAMEIKNIAKNNHRDDVTVYTVETGTNYKQHSVIAKMGTSSEPGIVIGAHMDTLPARDYRNKHAIKPGADDDGSGTVTVLEVARILCASDRRFNKPIYFIWYAAEEQGLVGSDYVVADFKKKNIQVSAVMQLDMTGYSPQNDPTMWLISDYVDKELTAYLEALITTYIKQPVKYTRCGYACSDHATWTQNGYAAAMPSEAAFKNHNHDIHTSRDTMDKLSLAHMTNYAKLAIAFVVELAELKS